MMKIWWIMMKIYWIMMNNDENIMKIFWKYDEIFNFYQWWTQFVVHLQFLSIMKSILSMIVVPFQFLSMMNSILSMIVVHFQFLSMMNSILSIIGVHFHFWSMMKIHFKILSTMNLGAWMGDPRNGWVNQTFIFKN